LHLSSYYLYLLSLFWFEGALAKQYRHDQKNKAYQTDTDFVNLQAETTLRVNVARLLMSVVSQFILIVILNKMINTQIKIQTRDAIESVTRVSEYEGTSY
jgi:hypothetical protein